MLFYLSVLLLSSTAEIAEVERLAVQQRREIKSGEVVVRAQYHDGKTIHLHIWWDGRSHRQDRFLGEFRDVQIWSDGRYLHWNNEPGDRPGSELVATVASDQDMGAWGAREPNDPRRIGMSPSDFLNLVHYPVDEFLSNPARKGSTSEPAQQAGIDCTLVSMTNLHGGTIRSWIAQERGYGVLKMEIEVGSGERKRVSVVETDLALNEPSKVWFPQHFHTWSSKGEDVEYDEDGTVEVISLNEPIPPEVFTFAGVGVPIGWPVSDRTRPDVSGPQAWDGQAVVSVKRAADASRVASRVNFVYLFGAALLALVGAALMWRVLFRRVAS